VNVAAEPDDLVGDDVPAPILGGREFGRFLLPVVQTFPVAEVAEAYRVSEQGHTRGKLVLLGG
jgi:hypothetical protein